MLSEFAEFPGVGRENRDVVCSCENAEEIANLKLAERVGVLARDFRKPNGINGFAITSRNRNDLASSSLRRRFRPFAGICRVFYSMALEMALDVAASMNVLANIFLKRLLTRGT